MFARAFYALRYFAARFFPQSQGDAPAASAPGRRYVVPGAYRAARTLPTADLSGGS
jgi:hypothetical protein